MSNLSQAIAVDGVVPFLGPLAKVSKKGEPQRALMITTFLCFAFAMMGSLNTVAPLVSICFLTCYSALNLSCLILSAVNAPRFISSSILYIYTLHTVFDSIVNISLALRVINIYVLSILRYSECCILFEKLNDISAS